MLPLSHLEEEKRLQALDLMEISKKQESTYESKKITVETLASYVDKLCRELGVAKVVGEYYVKSSDRCIRVDPVNPVTVLHLPLASEVLGQELKIKRTDKDTGRVVMLKPVDTVDGWGYWLCPCNASISLFSDGSGWQVV